MGVRVFGAERDGAALWCRDGSRDARWPSIKSRCRVGWRVRAHYGARSASDTACRSRYGAARPRCSRDLWYIDGGWQLPMKSTPIQSARGIILEPRSTFIDIVVRRSSPSNIRMNPVKTEEFVSAMRQLRTIRLRDGAVFWDCLLIRPSRTGSSRISSPRLG